MPVPRGATLVDLALKKGVPGFLETLTVVLEELQVESAIVAEETETNGKGTWEALQRALPNIEIRKVPHETFKELTRGEDVAGIVRTGEATPYANVILVSGVTF